MSLDWIYTALNVPTVPSQSSVRCLQWTADGQACFATKTAVYILTPDPGIHFDNASVITAPVDKNHPHPLGWFRTMIEFARSSAYNWPERSSDWGSVVMGSLDVALWAVACSPSGLTPGAGCAIATLSSNMDFTLWIASKNYLKGEWANVQEITPYLLEFYASSDDNPSLDKTLLGQVLSIAWSQQADFGKEPVSSIDGSFLVTGSRAGCLAFLRFDGVSAVSHVHTVVVADAWIAHVAVSAWRRTAPGTCEALVAYAATDGSIGLVTITQTLVETPASFGTAYAIDVRIVPEADAGIPYTRGVTALHWVEPAGRSPILIYATPGTLHLWAPPSPTGWAGATVLRLATQRLSVGSSALHPPTGALHVPARDALVLALLDGSFHVVHCLSRAPTWEAPAGDDALTGTGLSRTVRTLFALAEQGEVRDADVNRVSGLLAYDGAATVLWAHELCRPTDFSYKHDAKHNSMFIATQIGEHSDDEYVLREFVGVVKTARAAAGYAPLALLRPIFFHLRNPATLARVHLRVLELLLADIDTDAISVAIPAYTGALTAQAKADFQRSLATHLYGWDALLSLRLRLAVADFAWKLSTDAQRQGECGHVAQRLLSALAHRVLRAVLRHLVAAAAVLTPADAPLALRMAARTCLPGMLPELADEGAALADAVRTRFPDAAPDADEHCPACGVAVPLHDTAAAVCTNGHTWTRCSVTTLILSTPHVRTCVGCSRKALLADAVGRQGWALEALLGAVQRCLFCGNAFVSVL